MPIRTCLGMRTFRAYNGEVYGYLPLNSSSGIDAMRRSIPLCVTAVVLAVACTVRAQELKPPLPFPFYPLKIGNQWTYRAGKDAVVIRVDKEVPVQYTREGGAGKNEQAIGYQLRI